MLKTYNCVFMCVCVCVCAQHFLPSPWHILTVETIYYLQDSWQSTLWCFPLYGTKTCWHFNIMVPIMHSSVLCFWTSRQDWCHDMHLKLLPLMGNIWHVEKHRLEKSERAHCGVYIFVGLFTNGYKICRTIIFLYVLCSEIIATWMEFIPHPWWNPSRINSLPSTAIFIIILFTALLFLLLSFSASDKLFTQSIDLQALSALHLLTRITQRQRKRVGVRRVAGHFTKEQASEAKTQCSPKVIATHRVSCDIFIIEVRGKKKSPLCCTQLFVYAHHLQACFSNPRWQYYVVVSRMMEGKGSGKVFHVCRRALVKENVTGRATNVGNQRRIGARVRGATKGK